jgi:hypothetical protein
MLVVLPPEQSTRSKPKLHSSFAATHHPLTRRHPDVGKDVDDASACGRYDAGYPTRQ